MFESLLGQYKVSSEVLSLYYLILEDKFKANDEQRKNELRQLQIALTNVEASIQTLDEKLVSGELQSDRYNRLIDGLESKMNELQSQYNLLSQSASEYAKYIQYSAAFLADVLGYYKRVSLPTKQKVVGSIFPENFEFALSNKLQRTQ